jgi:DNA-binding transcriptional MerR regulator
MNGYVTSHITKLFGVSPQTVRNWSEEYSRYLSPLAAPGRGRNRTFSEDDFRVFALVAAMKRDGATNDDIHASLASGQRGDLPPLPPVDMQMMVMADHTRAIVTLQTERDTALAELQKARDEIQQLHGKNDLLTGQLDSAQEKIDKLNRKIWQLESRLDDD